MVCCWCVCCLSPVVWRLSNNFPLHEADVDPDIMAVDARDDKDAGELSI